MKELIKKSRQNSLYGGRIRRMFKIKGMAIGLLSFICIFFVASMLATGDTFFQTAGIIMATAPLVFAVPKDLGLSDTETKGLESLAKYFNDQLTEYKSGLIKSEDMQNSMKEAFDAIFKEKGLSKDQFDKLESALKVQGLEIKAIKETKNVVGKKLREHLKEHLTDDAIKNLKANKSGQIQIEMKAADVIMTPNASTNAPHALSYEVIPGIHESPVEPPVVLTTLSKGRTNSRTIFWINRVNEDGGAAFIAEGVLKPLKDWEYKEENSVAKKVAVSAKASSEMLNDFSYMEGEIRNLLYRDLFQVVDEKLLSGSTADEPTGILTGAGGYIGTGLDGTVAQANNADAIRAAMLQMRMINYRPNVVFMNPADAAVMDLTKSTDGHYIRIELDRVISSVRVIETTEIEAGKFLLMDTAKWIVRILESYRLEFGWENDDFRKNLVTVIAEMRLHSYQNSIDKGSVVYDSFATVKTAIEAPAAP